MGSGNKAKWRCAVRATCVPLLLVCIAAAASAQEVAVSRNRFAGVAERPLRALPAAGTVSIADEVWSAAGVTRLRVDSSDPQVAAVLRWRPVPAPRGADGGAGPAEEPPGTQRLRLTLILIVRPGQRRFLYKSQSQALTGGAFSELKRYRVGDGLETDLSGAPGRVTEIVIQDDGEAELRLSRDGDLLTLVVVTPEGGGEPTGPGPPYYAGRSLKFADYGLLATGYTENGYGELLLWDTLAAKINGFVSDAEEVLLLRAVLTQQAWRSRRFSLWVEGGAGFFRTEQSGTAAQEETVSYAAGLTLHYRDGAWGAALHYGLVDESGVAMLLAGWQVGSAWGLALSWQSFEGASGAGLGASLSF